MYATFSRQIHEGFQLMLKAILCDMDGTLIDTEYANATAYSRSLSEFGLYIDSDEFRRKYNGMSWKAFLPKILPSITEQQMLAVAERKKVIYRELLHETRLKQNIVEMVRALKRDNSIALVTTASRSATESLISYHRIGDLFDVVISGDDVDQPKPSPIPYLIAAEKLGVELQECLILEDSEIGIQSARSTGATVIVVDSE
ncbi:HAD family hydrolase [Vibrio sp. McD22-P3]|uniref:HAD family hydrolase n=1 Tax=Vibrio sp. McD22-P3 TaxID=2724880 RepID=UPI002E379F59|nr:HAD family phosphatase [Vibrio sp. McD22-P3]